MVESCVRGNYVGVVSLKEVRSNILVHSLRVIIYLTTTLLEITD